MWAYGIEDLTYTYNLWEVDLIGCRVISALKPGKIQDMKAYRTDLSEVVKFIYSIFNFIIKIQISFV